MPISRPAGAAGGRVRRQPHMHTNRFTAALALATLPLALAATPALAGKKDDAKAAAAAAPVPPSPAGGAGVPDGVSEPAPDTDSGPERMLREVVKGSGRKYYFRPFGADR